MADPEHVAILKEGVEVWNEWRDANIEVRPDLSGAHLGGAHLFDADLGRADLSGADLSKAILPGAHLWGANLSGACLSEAFLIDANLGETDLSGANLSGANLSGAFLIEADLVEANLSGADLSRADLTRADLSDADLTIATLSGANLERATLVGTNLTGASLDECRVYGLSAWGLDLTEVADQSNLVITPEDEPAITVDNLEVAQFVYLVLHNEKIRDVIDTIAKKGVLILGRFYDERKAVLDAIKERLRDFDLVPIVFDWYKPTRRDLTETVQLLANMSRFVVADVTDAKSIPQELSHIVPFLPSVPVRPIILAGEYEYSMFEHWSGYNTMLPVFTYDDKDHLIGNIETALIEPIEEWEAGYDKTKALSDAKNALEEENARLRAELAARSTDG